MYQFKSEKTGRHLQVGDIVRTHMNRTVPHKWNEPLDEYFYAIIKHKESVTWPGKLGGGPGFRCITMEETMKTMETMKKIHDIILNDSDMLEYYLFGTGEYAKENSNSDIGIDTNWLDPKINHDTDYPHKFTKRVEYVEEKKNQF